jgi:hypothetical protein
MDIKANVGICTKFHGKESKMVVIPQDEEMFEENQVVILLSAEDIEGVYDEIKSLINFIKSAQSISED